MRSRAIIAFMAGMLLPLGCGGGQTDPNEPGPMEKAGEAVDEAADDVGDTAEEGVDKTGDAIGEAGEEVDEATEDEPAPPPPDE